MSSGSEYKCCECQELHPQQAFIPHAGNDVEIAKEAARACCLGGVVKSAVIPARVGIRINLGPNTTLLVRILDSRLRGNDGNRE